MASGIDLLGLSLHEWQDLVRDTGEKPFHGDQIFSWLHQKQAATWDVMTNIPKGIRDRFISYYGPPAPKVTDSRMDDEAEKILLRWRDMTFSEAVAIRGTKGHTGCISSQVGCHVKCPYCASGKAGFERDLTAGEIVAQVLELKRRHPQLDHLVFMGMGEPFHNYANVIKAIRVINEPKGLNLGARKITISTSGVVPEIYRLADEDLQVNLAVSLGAPNEGLRKKLIPVAKVYNMQQLFDALDYYTHKTSRRVSLEYTLLRGVNDRFGHADELVGLARDRLVHVNLIAYNEVERLGFKAPKSMEVRAFFDHLNKKKIPVTIRNSKGSRIRAACGQLAGQAREKKQP